MGEEQYLNLVKEILSSGIESDNRTETKTLTKWGEKMVFNLENDTLPLLTTKKMFYRGIVEELLWFLSGSTDSNVLTKKGIHFWNANASKETLDKLGFFDRKEGDLGASYGFQFRHYGAEYKDYETNYSGKGIDQIKNVIDDLKNKSESRRILINLWNPRDINNVALPPCHILSHFRVINGELYSLLYQRSGDVGLGIPFNIASYSLLTHLFAKICGLKAKQFVHIIGDAHIYFDHIEPLREQLKRIPHTFPKINIKQKEKIEDYKFEDFELLGYECYPEIKMKMTV